MTVELQLTHLFSPALSFGEPCILAHVVDNGVTF